MCSEEQDFLKTYDSAQYERPSVTVDMVVFTIDEDNDLNVLLIQRAGHPYKGSWALPGGFLNAGKESTEEAAARELREETGVANAYLKQLYTFSSPKRDPRTHVVTIAYTALVSRQALSIQAGDDAANAKLFKVLRTDQGLQLKSQDIQVMEKDLAFDHNQIIHMAVERLQNRIDYEMDAFSLLENSQRFTIYELKRIYECIKGKSLDTANFRKMFRRNYVDTGKVRALGQKEQRYKARPAMLYSVGKGEKT